MLKVIGKALTEFIKLFPDAILTGIAGLAMHGIKFNRDIKDLDIIFNKYDIRFKDFISNNESIDEHDSSFSDVDYTIEFLGVKFDIIINKTVIPQRIKGINVAPKEHIISWKIKYASEGSEKHIQDLKYIP